MANHKRDLDWDEDEDDLETEDEPVTCHVFIVHQMQFDTAEPDAWPPLARKALIAFTRRVDAHAYYFEHHSEANPLCVECYEVREDG